MSKVQRIQELRRSNAARPIPGKRRHDEVPVEDLYPKEDTMAKDTAPAFARGTPTRRIRTSALEPGLDVITTPIPPNLRAHEPCVVKPCGIATMGRLREVERVAARQVPSLRGRAIRVYDVVFTDGTVAWDVGPLVTWFTTTAEEV